jgi:hypothetical protein
LVSHLRALKYNPYHTPYNPNFSAPPRETTNARFTRLSGLEARKKGESGENKFNWFPSFARLKTTHIIQPIINKTSRLGEQQLVYHLRALNYNQCRTLYIPLISAPPREPNNAGSPASADWKHGKRELEEQ